MTTVPDPLILYQTELNSAQAKAKDQKEATVRIVGEIAAQPLALAVQSVVHTILETKISEQQREIVRCKSNVRKQWWKSIRVFLDDEGLTWPITTVGAFVSCRAVSALIGLVSSSAYDLLFKPKIAFPTVECLLEFAFLRMGLIDSRSALVKEYLKVASCAGIAMLSSTSKSVALTSFAIYSAIRWIFNKSINLL